MRDEFDSFVFGSPQRRYILLARTSQAVQENLSLSTITPASHAGDQQTHNQDPMLIQACKTYLLVTINA